MSKRMIELFDAARRVSVPIVKVRTVDQASTLATIREASAEYPVLQWDAARGITSATRTEKGNSKGEQALVKAKVSLADTVNFADAMVAAAGLPEGTILFCHNAHRQLQSAEPAACAAAVQAVANLRDVFKLNYRMVVLAGPEVTLPVELENDTVSLTHELPTAAELQTVIKEVHDSAARDGVKQPAAEAMAKIVDATRGLSLFAAEQVVSMSLTMRGVDLDAVWERKRVAIEQTRGLAVYRGKERFSDIVGQEALKSHLRNRLKSRTPVGCVIILDEIDKVLANVEHDTSGVRTDQLRTMLTEMENNEWRGLVAVGVPGAGKTLVAKAFGNEAGVPAIMLDLGGMESKYVGDSEAYLRQSMQIIKAIGSGNAYFVATSNNASVMRPELQRRFTDGMWFFDLMSEAERMAAFDFYIERYELTKAQAKAMPNHDAWTGAEIRNCCRYAWDTGCTLAEAGQFIVPMARGRAEDIEKMRQHAQGRFLDANKPGPYQYTAKAMERQVTQVRGITLSGEPARIKGES